MPPSLPSRLAAIFIGEFVNKGSVALAYMYLARTLPPATYGDVEWALSIVTVALLVTDAGLATWSVARVAALPSASVGTLVAQVGWLRLSLAGPGCLVLFAIAWAHGGPAGSTLGVYALALLVAPFSLGYLFDGLLQTKFTALGNALRGATFLAAVMALVGVASPPTHVAAAEVLAALMLGLYGVTITRGVLRVAVRPSAGRHGLGALLAQSWPVGASDVVWGIHSSFGLIALGYLSRSTDAAWHSANLRLMLAIHTAVWLYLATLLPVLSRLLKDDTAGWRRLTEESLELSGWAGLGVAVVGTLGAHTILTTVFGSPFAASVPGFRAMIWVVPMSWISGHVRFSLIAANLPHLEYRARLVAVAVTIVLTLALAVPFGSAGTGVALLAGTVANLAAAWAFARGVLPECSYARSLRAPIAGAAASFLAGAALRPVAGEVLATLAAGALMGVMAVTVERERALDLMRAVTRRRKDARLHG